MLRSWSSFWSFILPALIVVGLFYFYPAYETFRLSFYDWSLLTPEKSFVFFGNYIELLRSERFWNAYKNLLLWIIVFPLLSAFVGLSLALIQNSIKTGTALLRTLFILPMTISYTAGGILWIFLYNPDFGTLNAGLRALGFGFLIQDWLGNADIVNLSLIAAGVWLWSGFGFLVFRAGLSTVPKELLEAAAIDGAKAWQRLFYVTIPLLKGPFIVVLGMSLLYALRVFDLVFAMTRGGPGTSSEVPALLLWRQTFEFYEAGNAMANAVILSLVTAIFAILVGRWLTRKAQA